MSATAIEWATDVWNPTTGCDRISPGCDHCYALTYAARLKAMGQEAYQADGDPRTSGEGFGLTVHPDRLRETWGRRRDGQRRRIFVNSMSDLFHKDVPLEFIGRVFNVMGGQPEHDFLILTKRPKAMARIVTAYYEATRQEPFPNVWLGVSIEDRRYVWRADHLRRTPAAVRFVSAEPLLGPLVPDAFSAVFGRVWHDRVDRPGLDLTGIDWLIVGGESGSGHRTCAPIWVKHLRDYAQVAGTAFFFKQWGGHTPKAGGRELDGRTWDELPSSAMTTTRS